MKTFLLLIFFITFSSLSFSQNNNWATVDYHYSKGPVSPEYQYSYDIIISNDGFGTVFYEKSGNRTEYSFNVDKKGLKKLKKALKKSKVLTANADEMVPKSTKIGGPERSILITMWQSPELDQKPQTISVPGEVSDEYKIGVENLYTTIEKLVPDSIKEKIKN